MISPIVVVKISQVVRRLGDRSISTITVCPPKVCSEDHLEQINVQRSNLFHNHHQSIFLYQEGREASRGASRCIHQQSLPPDKHSSFSPSLASSSTLAGQQQQTSLPSPGHGPQSPGLSLPVQYVPSPHSLP